MQIRKLIDIRIVAIIPEKCPHPAPIGSPPAPGHRVDVLGRSSLPQAPKRLHTMRNGVTVSGATEGGGLCVSF